MKSIQSIVFPFVVAAFLSGCALFSGDSPQQVSSAGQVQAGEPQELTEAELKELANIMPAAGGADTVQRASMTMQAFGLEAIGVLSDPSLDGAKRETYFHDLLARDLDIPVLAKFMLGKHWRKTQGEQREAYEKVFRIFILKTYSSRLGGSHFDRFEVIKSEKSGKNDILVHSQVSEGQRKPIRAVWRLRERNGKFVILDLMVEGISMALTLRQEFAAIIREKKDVNGLIATLLQRSA
ncbi:MAG: ABC transporter substrate-binding protein [Rhodospirillales bacterium]|nr:ABC transporter substrate-binding protein [Rhodospirillales bacterium]